MKLEHNPGHCFRCGAPYVMEANSDVLVNGEPLEAPAIMDGEFVLGMYGSYGSFVDTTIDAISNHPSHSLPMEPLPELIEGTCMTCYMQHFVTLCHDCAHALCDWLGISKETQKQTTSHTAAYKALHPEHQGWEDERKT